VIRTYVDGPAWLTGGEFGPEASLIALIVLWLGLYILIRMTRDLAWKYGQPEIKPAGLSVGLGHSIQVTPPTSVSAPAQNPPVTRNLPVAHPTDEPNSTLTQSVPEPISPEHTESLSPASSPEPENSVESASPTSSTEPAEAEMEQGPKNTP
jgi:hypothetical protein